MVLHWNHASSPRLEDDKTPLIQRDSTSAMAAPNMITIETRRMILRAAEQEDAIALHQIMSDAETMRFWSELPHADLARTKAWVSSMLRSTQNGVTDFMICLKSDIGGVLTIPERARPRIIGKVGIFRARPSHEIGFVLDRSYWGKDLATEALTTLLAYLFSLKKGYVVDTALNTTGLDPHVNLSDEELRSPWMYPAITADTEPRNAASIGLLKKLGFVETGRVERSFRLGDEWQDTLYLRLTREKWLDEDK
ncbi:hypothetical protein CLAFUW4_11560 [Fulvia fulva]|uniref:N-acetyltransferase domain-containing protein n=1 Tax=Passalora fulva TaxID=5499 RepID=A0A9Q8URQ1_PASFU|nr:uncharacterized protein CLAFUR5_10603 [Fulvia fulva]KAK4620624.1 hypothetical protein CLAFUR0_11574 [Fulvia fulva]UJO19973.1 hypothetical protein CLAFUR5_10603 [Fulvia fulva]WPV17776.1 hypothetical protein CLAFUW4_11560 [Fulvia fulva]